MEQASVPAMAAFVIGATGMVGRKLVAELAQSEHFTRIVTLGRRVVAYDGPGKEKLDQHIVNFDRIDLYKALLENLDVGVNTMGTTRAYAGSPEQFTKIDHDIPLQVARLFKEANDPSKPLHMLNIDLSGACASATGTSSLLLLPRTKGLLEQHLTELGFAKVSIFRPGLLVYEGGAKWERPRRAESIAVALHKPLYLLSGGHAVARAMRIVAEMAIAAGEPLHRYDNRSIKKLADAK